MKQIVLMLIWGVNVLIFQNILNISNNLSLVIFLLGLIIFFSFRKILWISLLPPVLMIALFGWLSTIQASNDREWQDDVKNLPKIEINNENVLIQNLRNAKWHDDEHSISWENRNYDMTKLTSLSLIVEPFHGSKLMAHTMLSFGFGDQGHVIVSVEARKEAFEQYSLVAGALRQFELIYIFGDEKDLLTLRALQRGSALHLYPIKADTEFMISLFKDMAMSANTLHKKPKFYRTLRDNCTTTLVKHIDRHFQQRVGTRLETIFPAKAGELLFKLGRMDTKLSYQEVKNASRIDHLVLKYRNEKERFSSLLHADLELAYKQR